MKAKDYRVLTSDSSSSLQRQVRNFLEEGWELNGNMEMTSGNTQGISYQNFVQSMFLPNDTKSMEDRGYEKVECTKCEHNGWNTVHHSRGFYQEPCRHCKGRGFNWEYFASK